MACSGTRKVKQGITLNKKLEILKMHDSMSGSVKLNELANILKISRSTLVTILNNRKSIETAPETDRYRCRTRNKRDNPCAGKSKYQALEEALARWVTEIKAKGEAFSGVILRNKAKQLAAEMGYMSFTASNGWSDRFKKKYSIEYKLKPCFCEYKLKEKIPDKTNYGVENFLDKVYEDMKKEENFSTECKNNNQAVGKKSKITMLGIKLIQWLDEARNELNLTKISGNLIKEMALSLAGVMGATNFTASSGWLNRFQKKYHLLKHKKCKNCQSKLHKSNNNCKNDKGISVFEEQQNMKTSFNVKLEKENDDSQTNNILQENS